MSKVDVFVEWPRSKNLKDLLINAKLKSILENPQKEKQFIKLRFVYGPRKEIYHITQSWLESNKLRIFYNLRPV